MRLAMVAGEASGDLLAGLLLKGLKARWPDLAAAGYRAVDLGDKSFLMLRNHGLLTVAATVPDAFLLMYVFEATCMIQVRAMAGGAELIPIDPRIISGAQAMVWQVTGSLGGALAWPALLRKLDRVDPGFRD